MKRILGAVSSVILGLFLALVLASPASATTYCVPAFSAACPNNGTNVAQADLELALSANASDGTDDTVRIAPGTFSASTAGDNDGTFEASGTDEVEIIGAGKGATVLTSAATINQYLVNFLDRPTTTRNLSLVIPETFPNGGGAGVQARHGVFENVELESRNPGSSGFSSMIGNSVIRDTSIFGSNGGTISDAIRPNELQAGTLLVEDTSITDASNGISTAGSTVPITVHRTTIEDPLQNAVSAAQGGHVTIDNSVLIGGGQPPLTAVSNNANPVGIDARNLTIVAGSVTNQPAIYALVLNAAGNGAADISVRDSIIKGFDSDYAAQAPANASIGNAGIEIAFSNTVGGGSVLGDSLADTHDLISLDPLFVDAAANDFDLQPGSPSIDIAENVAPFNTDVLGRVRPQDGDGDGTSVPDQGAYEAPKKPTCLNDPSLCPVPPTCETDPSLCPDPPTCETDPSLCPDPPTCKTTPSLCPEDDEVVPKLSRIKFRAPGKKAGRLSVRVSERARVTAVFKRLPPGKLRKLRLTRKAAAAGAVKLPIRKGKLKPGRYRLTIVAVDGAGNRSKVVKRKIRVPRP